MIRVKPDEAAFYALAKANRQQDVSVRDTINSPECPVPYKRAWYLLEKWSARGWYTYGVTLDLGWFLPDAPDSLPSRSE